MYFSELEFFSISSEPITFNLPKSSQYRTNNYFHRFNHILCFDIFISSHIVICNPVFQKKTTKDACDEGIIFTFIYAKNSNNYFSVHDSAADITPTMMEIYTKI